MTPITEYLFRGPRPKSLTDLKVQGFYAVIDLESGVYEKLQDDQYEKEKREGNIDIWFGDFDLSNVFPPKKWEVLNIISVLDSMNRHKRKTYIHCYRGKDRTGFICAAYRMKYNGFAYVTARDEMLRLGFNNLFYFWWKPFLKKYATKS